jgi:hypothetical protein
LAGHREAGGRAGRRAGGRARRSYSDYTREVRCLEGRWGAGKSGKGLRSC